jgi:hypothetical protein
VIGIVEIVDRVMLRSERRERIRAEANRLVGDFGLDADSQARGRGRDANDLETARLWSRVALALARATGRRAGEAGGRSNGEGRRGHSISGELLAAAALAASRTVAA